MPVLYHHAASPTCRAIRITLREFKVEPELVEERPWERREAFLLLNPAGDIPVLQDDDDTIVVGVHAITEYCDEVYGQQGEAQQRLLPEAKKDRAEVRRLLHWAHNKLHHDVTFHLVGEKIYKRQMPPSLGGGSPDTNALRAARSNIKWHMQYLGHLLSTRNWLGGDEFSLADLAIAAHLSIADFLAEVPWQEDQATREWYARMKSRPSFRTLLQDRIRGIQPPAYYINPDF